MPSLARSLPILLLMALLCSRGSAADAPSPAREIDDLVTKLSSEDFDERNAATERLAAMGELAREALEQAAAGKDPEIRIAAAELLGKLGKTVLNFLVVKGDGEPAAGIEGELNIGAEGVGNDAVLQPFVTAADGTASAGRLESGIYELAFNFKNASSAYIASNMRVRLMPGVNRLVIPISKGGSVQASVLDEDGKPLKDVKLSVAISSKTTDEEGKVRLDNVVEGIFHPTWTRENESSDGPLIRVRTGKVTEVPAFRLPPKAHGGSLALTLLGENGEPLANANAFVSLLPHLDDPAAEFRVLHDEYQKWAGVEFEPPHHTDDKGLLILEHLKPGRYSLLIRNYETGLRSAAMFAPWVKSDTDFDLFSVEELEIKDGEKQAQTLHPVPGGRIAGKVSLADNDVPPDTQITIMHERYASLVAPQDKLDFEMSDADMLEPPLAQDGTFEIKHLPPGRYCAYIKSSESSAFVFNIEVVNGQAAELAEIKLPALKKAAGELKGIKGKVLLPDGKPCVDADVYLYSDNTISTTTESTSEEGEFSLENARSDLHGTPTRLKVFAPGYEPANVDLRAGVLPPQLVINLRTQQYGGVQVKTVDDAGHPLAGVKLWPIGANPAARLHVKRSDATGVLSFTGLASGERQFNVEKAGYFADVVPSAIIVPGKENSAATVTLHPGLKITGSMELPAHYPPANIGIVASDVKNSTQTWTTINDNGEFTFSGLAPGTYLISAAAGGCSLDSAPLRVTLPRDQKTPAHVSLRLVRNGAVALNFGAANADRSMKLLPSTIFKNIDQFWYYYSLDLIHVIDGDGRAELVQAPGTCIPFVLDENVDDLLARTVVGSAADPVTLEALPSTIDLSKLPATDAKLKNGTAGVSVTFVPVYPEGLPREALSQTVDVILAGPNGMCSMVYRTQTGPPVTKIIGTPPPDFQIERQTFNLSKLPAGDYKILTLLYSEHADVIGQQLLAETTLKEGESVNLGEFKLPIPKSNLKLDAFSPEQPDLDKGDTFKP
jgi:hypothetical protein